MDFFTVPTITFGVLYCFFVIGHDRRRILHVNVTKHPTSGWIMQQLREAIFYAFDILYLNDRDLRQLPLIERKEIGDGGASLRLSLLSITIKQALSRQIYQWKQRYGPSWAYLDISVLLPVNLF